ncbi:NAD(P)-dependent oxidoreductase [Roseateles oligotrophus]|uniref:dihydrouracil dehydrogenase (NAD(+)) n=1 Tax=Roseateles oligotrophus TaxID=1769250 RepID=A0ABT2YLL4_9BURK|nr:NAD(P)-dependent oxidoreductase [Roseateles oligotrophus]MCV2370887.1 NAD(P)-dependent oxidoreductase [Roseateles oligotrophus]
MDQNTAGRQAGRLKQEQYLSNFSDARPPLSRAQALVEAERCYYCFDAPCITACPTGIDVPSFIQRIAQDNVRGAAEAILSANPLGGMCARVCPTEVLCEQSCVRNGCEEKPVEIGLLQRYATDAFFANADAKPLFSRAAGSGKTVAVVGAGPAGLAAAHGLARLGHAVTMFDANAKLGGLNEYGLATYKTPGGFAQQEVDWLLAIGGITVKAEQKLGRDFDLAQLTAEFDAVFLGLGLAGVNALQVATPACEGLRPAVDFIKELRQSDPMDVKVGRQVVVIGGGMTAVDAAVQCKLLGAREVTMVYRRGADALSASPYEQDWAQKHGVLLRCWAAPLEVLSEGGQVSGVRFAVTAQQGDQVGETGEQFSLNADMVLMAIGQRFEADLPAIDLQGGRIATEADGRIPGHPKLWAGGDCRYGGRDLTVEAVEHGKQAALSIDAFLRS